MRLGEIIKAYRDSHDMSMDTFASKAGLTKAYISMLENGNTSRAGGYPTPSIKTYRSCANAMNMDINVLLSSVEETIRINDQPSPSPALSSEETELVTAWRKAEEPIKVSVRKLLDIPASSEKKDAASSISKAG